MSEGGFKAADYAVVALDETTAARFVTRHHYAGSMPAARLCFGLLTRDDRLAVDGTVVDGMALVGVAVLSVPMRSAVLTNVFPDLEPYTEALELGRFVLTDTPANAESWMLARVWKLAADTGIRGVVSFADPMARHRDVIDTLPDGTTTLRREVITPGHVGVIYQATNAIACGRSTARTLNVLPRHGLVLSERTLSKIRTSDRGSDAAIRSLVNLGAQPPRAGQNPREWLHDALATLEVRKVRHPGNFRYAWPLGSSRRAVRIATNRTPYPKAASSLLVVEQPEHGKRTPAPTFAGDGQ